MARFSYFKKIVLLSFSITTLSLFSDGVWGKEEKEQLMSLCPNDLSTNINNRPMEAEHYLFQQWQTMVRNFSPILHEGGRPSVFISHAWHLNAEGLPVDTQSTTEEALYYDQIDLQLANILKSAGFEVHYDKDITNSQGIIDEGATPFMEKKVRESDVILGVCTPLYHIRSTRPSGVKIEVDRIKDRLSGSATVGFYIPLLVHALDKRYNPSELLVGQEHERMNQVIYLDGRDKSTFISNMWRLFHRLWKPVKLKWEDNPKYDPQTSPLNQRYIKALGDLLQSEDYYDHSGQPIPSGIKEGLKSDYSNLRILTTISEDLSANTVATLIKQEIEAHQELLHTSKDQHIVAFLGNTGTGKSTLINFLAGRELRADEYGQGYELVNQDDLTAMKVGSGADSETVYPQSIQVGELLCFDLPGFNDTSGSIRDLVNSAFIRQILIEAASVRFVFVAGQDEITVHRSKIVKKLFNGVKLAFKSPEIIENNSMLIVTKSNFQDCSKAINFWLKKMRSAHGTELQDQLQVWHTKNRLFHMPHSSFNDIEDQQINIRESMLNGIRQMDPATQEDMREFNISGFFPPEINMPLQNMFLYVLQEQSKKDIKQWERLEKFIDDYWVSTEEMKEEFSKELAHYRSENLWQEFWENVDKQLSQEMVLLKEVCQDPYDQACHTFQSNYKANRQKYINKYLLCLTIKSKEYQLLQKGYDETGSRRILQQLMHQYDEASCDQIVQLVPMQVGQGHDEVFLRFLKGKLIYKPKTDSDEGKIEILFTSFLNPLEGTFDLSRCGDAGKYLSIATGYRKSKLSANKDKIEIWITPKFVMENALSTSATHYGPIMTSDKWTAPIGIIWTYGNWADNDGRCDYLTNKQFDDISSKNLYENWKDVSWHNSDRTNRCLHAHLIPSGGALNAVVSSARNWGALSVSFKFIFN